MPKHSTDGEKKKKDILYVHFPLYNETLQRHIKKAGDIMAHSEMMKDARLGGFTEGYQEGIKNVVAVGKMVQDAVANDAIKFFKPQIDDLKKQAKTLHYDHEKQLEYIKQESDKRQKAKIARVKKYDRPYTYVTPMSAEEIPANSIIDIVDHVEKTLNDKFVKPKNPSIRQQLKLGKYTAIKLTSQKKTGQNAIIEIPIRLNFEAGSIPAERVLKQRSDYLGRLWAS